MDFDSLGQHDLPLIGGLCHVQWISTCWVSMICPSLGDFATYNGLWPSGSQWSYNKIEHWQKNQWHIESGTKNDEKWVPKDQLLLVVQGSDHHTVSNDHTHKKEHRQKNQWHIKSGTKNDAKWVPKDQLLLVVQGSDRHTVRWKWSNLSEWFEDFGWKPSSLVDEAMMVNWLLDDVRSKNNERAEDQVGSLAFSCYCTWAYACTKS